MKILWKSDCTSLLQVIISPALEAATGTQPSGLLTPISPPQSSPLHCCSSLVLRSMMHNTATSLGFVTWAAVSSNNFKVRRYSWPRSSFSKAFFLNLNASNFSFPEPQLLLCKFWHFKLLMKLSWRWNSGLCVEYVKCMFLPANPSTRL